MANSIITQVSRDDVQRQNGPAKRSGGNFFTRLICCGRKEEEDERNGTAGRNSTSGNPSLPHVTPAERAVSPPGEALLPPILQQDAQKKCLVLDLDETLVHSSFKPISGADFVIPVEIDDQVHQVYVAKRPGVDQFLKRMGALFEVVVFTASLAKYADPVLDLLDPDRVVRHRLFREACVNHKGNYVKDLSKLGRKLQWVIIIDNSPASYMFHPANAVPIDSWFDDLNDTELLDLIPFLEDLTKVDDVCAVLDQHRN